MPLRRALTSGIRRFLDQRGYTLAGNGRVHDVIFARYLRFLFAASGVDCVLDVGANEGQYAQFLRSEVGYRGLVVSFEPISDVAERLQAKSVTDPQWQVRRLALGENEGTATLNVASASDLSSFLRPTRVATRQFADAVSITRTESVLVRRLRDLLPELEHEYGFTRPYLKIDTQGYDFAVLRGAGSTLVQFVAAQTELSFRALYEGSPNWLDVAAFFRENEFSVGEFSRILGDNSLRPMEMDCVFVNDRLVRPERDKGAINVTRNGAIAESRRRHASRGPKAVLRTPRSRNPKASLV